MSPRSVKTVFFSPTGTTGKVVAAIGRGLAAESLESFDLTLPGASLPGEATVGDVLIVGVPVYAGRVPALAVERLRELRGNGAYCVAVVVYGNREYEDALLELKELMTAAGFRVIAGSAFIGEHSFSTKDLPIAPGRPDTEDLLVANEFGNRLQKMLSGYTVTDTTEVHVPGESPYKEGMGNLPFTPETDHDRCTLCGTCAEHCPAGAIRLGDRVETDADLCILCCACVKNCPEQAVALLAPPLKEKAVWLNENCRTRKEPLLFLV